MVIDFYSSIGIESELNGATKIAEKALYDISSIYKDTTFLTEVKYDIYSLRSGNIAIEIANSKKGKPSGVYITQAKVWAHISDKIYIASVSKIKNYIETKTPFKTINNAGDQNALLLLFKADQILEDIFVDIESLSKKEAIEKIMEIVNES